MAANVWDEYDYSEEDEAKSPGGPKPDMLVRKSSIPCRIKSDNKMWAVCIGTNLGFVEESVEEGMSLWIKRGQMECTDSTAGSVSLSKKSCMGGWFSSVGLNSWVNVDAIL